MESTKCHFYVQSNAWCSSRFTAPHYSMGCTYTTIVGSVTIWKLMKHERVFRFGFHSLVKFLWQLLNSVCPGRDPPFSLTIEMCELFGPDSGIKLCMSEWGTMTAGLCKYILGYSILILLCVFECFRGNITLSTKAINMLTQVCKCRTFSQCIVNV